MDKRTTPTQLKPCPGCGKSSIRVIGGSGTAGGPKHWCGCDYCSWRTWGDTEAEAIAAWNQRPAQEAESELVEELRQCHDYGYMPAKTRALVDMAADRIEELETALRFGLDLYGTEGPSRWPVEARLKFDELARRALGAGE